MKKLALLILFSVSTLAVHFAFSSESVDRPADVLAKDWIPISERLGFVILPLRETPVRVDSQTLVAPPKVLSAALMSPAKGYFMAKTSKGWRRLVVAEPI